MDKENQYKSLKTLAKSVAKACADLEKGILSQQAIQEMLSEIRELEERAIILNYKAIEKLAKGDIPELKTKTKAPKEESGSLTFSFEPIEEELNEPETEPDNQISLIDSIKEIRETDPIKEEVIEPKFEAPEPVTEKSGDDKPKPKSKPKKSKEKKATINEVVKSTSKPTLAQKLSEKPLDDIHSGLNVNSRIGLVKSLFKGDADALKAFLSSLEETGSYEKAADLLMSAVEEHSWDAEAPAVAKVQELIQRRFIA